MVAQLALGLYLVERLALRVAAGRSATGATNAREVLGSPTRHSPQSGVLIAPSFILRNMDCGAIAGGERKDCGVRLWGLGRWAVPLVRCSYRSAVPSLIAVSRAAAFASSIVSGPMRIA